MPTVYGFGNTLISEKRLDGLKAGELAKITARAGPTRAVLALDAGARPFEAIGIGKPLSVEIAYVYTGSLSAPSFFGNPPDMLMTSAIKRLPVFEAAPRAVNSLFKNVSQSFKFSDIAANQPGTPLIYHTPALSDRGTTVTVELVFDHFPEESFSQIGSLISSAAGIPVFAPATGFLMAGGILVKLLARIAEKVIDGKPSFSQTVSIDVDRPGLGNTQPGFLIISESSEISSLVEREELEFRPREGLKNTTTGKPYAGSAAYVVLTLDGSDRPDYASFSHTMASAAVLDKFLHTGEQRPTGTGLLLDALKAFNDLHFRAKAESLKQRMAGIELSSDEGKKLKTLFDAYLRNISDNDLKPKLG